jgi:Rrf2 family protein
MHSFLKIPQKVHHALLVVGKLAERHADGDPISLQEIAKETGLSHGFLEEVAGHLRRAQIIESRRGAHGGYLLAHAPADITVSDIVEAIEGPITMVDCLSESIGCVIATGCTNKNVWGRLQQRVQATLRETTVADMMSAYAK